MVDLNQTIVELEALLALATPGPAREGVRVDGSAWLSLGDGMRGPHAQGDVHLPAADVIALSAAFNAAPSLIARIRDLERIEAGVRGLVECWRACGDQEVGQAYSGPYYGCADELSALLNRPADGGK